jgi:23S rRNA (uracil1939-C5)-methyltransferase
MPEKNKSYEAVITDLSFEGNGICKVDGMTVFVPNTAVGDKIKLLIVKLLKSYAFGKLEEIIVPSEERTEPDCENFHKCG